MARNPERWRLLVMPPGEGAWNMGVDEALLDFAEISDYAATLRLYAWQPPCLSLGFGQPYRDMDRKRIEGMGWGAVRRITGGRAILHTDELTYAVVGRADGAHLKGDIPQSYKRISSALLHALQLLGLAASAEEIAAGGQPAGLGSICFESPGTFEITVGGKKLIGSAQARRSRVVLQHGSLPLRGDITRITQALHYGSEAARNGAAERLRSKAITLEAGLGRTLSWETAAAAMVEAFQDNLDVRLDQGELSQEEEYRSAELAENKYGQSDWLQRV